MCALRSLGFLHAALSCPRVREVGPGRFPALGLRPRRLEEGTPTLYLAAQARDLADLIEEWTVTAHQGPRDPGGAASPSTQRFSNPFAPSKTPPIHYDFVFFGFWLSHVPIDRFDAFWTMVRGALKPAARAFFVDNLAAPDAVARDQRMDTGGIAERRFNDGQTFRIVKIFHEPSALAARLAGLGWAADIRATPNFFLYGTAAPR